jgi:peptide/nickel transport system substrate-binding protein
MDPRSTSSIDVVQNVYETLTYIQPNGTITPGLATSWSQDSSGTVWTFNLRQGVTFHDGTAFDSNAVVWSINNIVKWGSGDTPDVWSVFKSVTATGPYTVQITLTQPVYAPVFTSAAYSAFIMSANTVAYSNVKNDTLDLHNWFSAFHDDGSGPYTIDSTASSLTGGQIVLNAYPKYWGGWKNGQATTVLFKFVTNVNTAIQLAQQGQLDVIGVSGQYQYVPQLLSAGLNIKSGTSFSAIWLLFNTQKPVLSNPLVRQALLTALNYPQIINQAYYGYGQSFGGIINPGKPFYDPNAPNFGLNGNVTKAKALLAQAGYPNGLGVTWTITYSSGSPFLGTAAQVMQTYWQPLGVTLNIVGEGFGVLAKQAGYYDPKTGTTFSPGPTSYASTSACQDILLLNWSGATADPWLVPDELFAIQSPPYQDSIIYNWSYWRNQTFTDLLNKARVDETANPTLATQEFKQLNLMYYQAAPGYGLFAENQIWVVSPHWASTATMNPYYGFDYFFYYQLTYTP